MNTHEGYSKKTLDNTNVLLTGGGDKSLADFIGGIQYDSASEKILYRAANTNTWSSDLPAITNVKLVNDTTSTSDFAILLKNSATINDVIGPVKACPRITVNPDSGLLSAAEAIFQGTVDFTDDTNHFGTARFYNDFHIGTDENPVSVAHYGTYGHYGLSDHYGNINLHNYNITNVTSINGSGTLVMGQTSLSNLSVGGDASIGGRLNVGSTINGYTNSFIIGDITASGTVRTNGDLITHNIKPLATNTYNIGNSSKYYESLYANNIFSKFISTYDNYILKPLGGDIRYSGSISGALCITLPTNLTDGTISMWIDVASDYSSFSVYISGALMNRSWDMTNAVVYGELHTVYFCTGSIYIGETTDLWYYPNISVRDITCDTTSFTNIKGLQWSVTFESNMGSVISSSFVYAVLSPDLSGYLTSQDHYKTNITAGTAGTSSATSGNTLAVPYVTVNANGHVTGYGTHTHTITGFLTGQDHYKTSITSGTIGTSSATSGSTLSVPYITVNSNGHVSGYGTHTHTISGFVPSNGYLFNFDLRGYTDNTYNTNLNVSNNDTVGIYYGDCLKGFVDADGINIYHRTIGTSGTAGTSSATSGSTLSVPYITTDGFGHVTNKGVHTHTVTGFASSSHSHSLSIATTSDSSSITLSANTKYKLTAGGNTYVFTTPSDLVGNTGSYLPLSGGTMTGLIVRENAGMWYMGRDTALIRQNGANNNGSGWAPVLSVKTLNGSYELGAISESSNVQDRLIVSYVTDTDYNNNTNASRKISFPDSSGTLALISDIGVIVDSTSSTFYPCGYTNLTTSGLRVSTLYSYSGFYVTTSGAYHSSDIRLKYDILDIYDKDIIRLFNTDHGYIHSFRWKDTDKPAFGFIAQELMDYCPEAVDFNVDTGFYTVNYEMALSKVVGVLFKKIKKQDLEIKKLKKLLENRK